MKKKVIPTVVVPFDISDIPTIPVYYNPEIHTFEKRNISSED